MELEPLRFAFAEQISKFLYASITIGKAYRNVKTRTLKVLNAVNREINYLFLNLPLYILNKVYDQKVHCI